MKETNIDQQTTSTEQTISIEQKTSAEQTISPELLKQEYEKLQFNYDCLVKENQQLIAENQTLVEQTQKQQKDIQRLQSSADNSDMFRDQLVALKSDFDSYKRRVRNDAAQNRKEGQRDVLEKLLPILDTFDLAKLHLDDENLKAYEMIFSQLEKLLAEFGVEKITPLGMEFDVHTMNAFASKPSGEENVGKVVEVYQSGYSFDGKIIRYAEVIVGA